MSTTSEVKAGLDSIAGQIAGAQRLEAQAINGLLTARNQLAGIPTQYAEVLATIDGFTPTGPFEEMTKDEKGLLATEFLALKAALETKLDDLGVPY